MLGGRGTVQRQPLVIRADDPSSASVGADQGALFAFDFTTSGTADQATGFPCAYSIPWEITGGEAVFEYTDPDAQANETARARAGEMFVRLQIEYQDWEVPTDDRCQIDILGVLDLSLIHI